eukprot:CAMPEP_0113709196 /NCGR_PEP_ID=MMETSP0038_2-20120614/29430_1 /TAXON_ID=2898 /ORGANISM="Cryptomonas paramecium" /LENGTH=162 /DNA_ID=CAMNT_0000635041 /DNA_START=69 /DNA_END=557 /DNA_ORIENTATION=+ /assembly_acc=CAM_ASM_000170
MQHLEKCGCPIQNPNTYFLVRHCEENVGGGFDPVAANSKDKAGGVVLCQNHLRNLEHTELTLTHELIHAYDDCRAYLNWSNCYHHACSEIRAASLSGDCKMLQEFGRGHTNFQGQGKVCARRRAILSVAMNPQCSGEGVAAAAVDKVFDRCYRDTAPFDRVP